VIVENNNYVLWIGFLLLLIESVIYIVFCILVTLLICIIGILMGIYFFSKIKEKRNNGKIKEMFMKCKGLEMDYSETKGDPE
jgi:predicted membrane protein